MGEAAAWSGGDVEMTGGRPADGDAPSRPNGVIDGAVESGDRGDRAADEGRSENAEPAEQSASAGRSEPAEQRDHRGVRRWLTGVLSGVWPRQEWPLAIVLCGIVLSLLVVVLDDFRPGAVLFSGCLLLGSLLRLVLPDRQAGLLALRSRVIDVLLMLIMGLCLLLLALLIPDLPAGGLPAIQQ